MPQRRARQPGQRAGPAAELEGRQGLLLLLLHGARRVRRRDGRQQRRERPSGTLKTAAVTETRHHDQEPRVVCMARSAEKNRANLPLGSRQAATREAARQSEDSQTIPPMLRCWLCTTTSRRPPGGQEPGHVDLAGLVLRPAVVELEETGRSAVSPDRGEWRVSALFSLYSCRCKAKRRLRALASVRHSTPAHLSAPTCAWRPRNRRRRTAEQLLQLCTRCEVTFWGVSSCILAPRPARMKGLRFASQPAYPNCLVILH